MTIGFQCLTTIRYGGQGIGWVCADPGRGGGGEKVWTPSKISRYMGKSRSKPTPAPEEISWFRALGLGGRGNLFHWNALIRTDCLMKDQARGGGGVTLYQLGAWDLLKMMAYTWLR